MGVLIPAGWHHMKAPCKIRIQNFILKSNIFFDSLSDPKIGDKKIPRQTVRGYLFRNRLGIQSVTAVGYPMIPPLPKVFGLADRFRLTGDLFTPILPEHGIVPIRCR